MPRRAILWLLVAVTALLPLATAAAWHTHDESVNRHCESCHVAHMPPVVEAAVVVAIAPPAAYDWHTAACPETGAVAPLLASRPSRAPPAA